VPPAFIAGFGSRFKLNTLVGVKYLLTKEMNDIPRGYAYLTTIGDVDVYENTFYLPLGFTYDSYIRVGSFLDLSADLKDTILLEAFVWSVPNDHRPETYGLRNKVVPDGNSYEEQISNLRKNALRITEHTNDSIKGNVTLDADGLLFISIPFDEGWGLKVDGRKTNIEQVNIGFMGVFLKKGFHEIDLRYSVPFLRTGAMISCVGVLMFLILFFKLGLVPKKVQNG
jgi:uncharacterized membrane protein YfhO